MSIKTLIKNLPINKTTFVEHESSSEFSIIMKEKRLMGENLEANTFDISIKVPVIV